MKLQRLLEKISELHPSDVTLIVNRFDKRPPHVIHMGAADKSPESPLFLQTVKVTTKMFLQRKGPHNCFLNRRSWMTCHFKYRGQR